MLKICLLACVLVATATAIWTPRRCWECKNAKSNAECLASGEIRYCQPNQMSCQNTVRASNGKVWIEKGCKQTQACRNNQMQNGGAAWIGMQCSINPQNIVCRCCCESNECNDKALYCRGTWEQRQLLAMEQGVHPCGSPLCSNRGQCTNNVCQCENGFEGKHCENKIVPDDGEIVEDRKEDVSIIRPTGNPCEDGVPCGNGATCVFITLGQYRCECADGWEGINCNTPVA